MIVPPSLFRLLADLVLVVHLGIVVFVIAGLILVVTGNLRGWAWVNRLWFRALHLVAIAFVVLQSWLGVTCPLTLLEYWLRTRAGEATYGGGFIEHWVEWVLFYDAPTWVFTAVYTVFGLLVLAVWWYFPPHNGRLTTASSEGPPRIKRRG